MSAGVIRKEDSAEYGPWKPELFGTSGHPSRVKLPTVDDIDRMQRSAHSEGFDQGLRDGQARAQSEVQRLASLVSALESDLTRFDRELANDVLRFAMVVAQSVLRSALTYRAELVLPVIREALSEMPSAGQTRRLHLHPEDAALVKQYDNAVDASNQLTIVEDARIERGGCRLRTDNAEIDATLATRWARAMAVWGRDDKWLELSTTGDEEAGDDR
jgi:flagellar assembly protein FliH